MYQRCFIICFAKYGKIHHTNQSVYASTIQMSISVKNLSTWICLNINSVNLNFYLSNEFLFFIVLLGCVNYLFYFLAITRNHLQYMCHLLSKKTPSWRLLSFVAKVSLKSVVIEMKFIVITCVLALITLCHANETLYRENDDFNRDDGISGFSGYIEGSQTDLSDSLDGVVVFSFKRTVRHR